MWNNNEIKLKITVLFKKNTFTSFFFFFFGERHLLVSSTFKKKKKSINHMLPINKKLYFHKT